MLDFTLNFHNIVNSKLSFNLNFFLIFGICIMFFGFSGVLVYNKNLIFLLISLEIILLGINTVIIPASVFFDDIVGYIFSLFTLSVAGSEASLGLALAIILYRVDKNIKVVVTNKLKT